LIPNFYSGLSGLQLPIPKYKYPEEYKDSSRLTYYASLFNSIEINSSFYKLPLQRTVSNWVNQVPSDFKFTFKLWREITHCKGLEFNEDHIEQFFNVIGMAASKQGAVLIQFPPSLGITNIHQLDHLLRAVIRINEEHKWDIAIEFRNKSWYQDDTYDLLTQYGCSMVIQDIPRSATPLIDHSQEKAIYVRFHGPTGNYRDSYSESFLAEYATYIKEWISDGKTVYAYFNNTMGDAYNNLRSLSRFVNE
jgi:uncharacterized protein YecE (DUF72 family)